MQCMAPFAPCQGYSRFHVQEGKGPDGLWYRSYDMYGIIIDKG